MEFSEVERKAYELDPTRWVDAPRVREFVHIDPQADLEIDTQSALGSGGFGRCMKALLKRGGGSTGAYEHVNVAVKMLFASTKVTEDLLKTFYVEAYQMSQLVHPNVVLLHGACCRPPHLVLVQELAELGRCVHRVQCAAALRGRGAALHWCCSSTPTSLLRAWRARVCCGGVCPRAPGKSLYVGTAVGAQNSVATTRTPVPPCCMRVASRD